MGVCAMEVSCPVPVPTRDGSGSTFASCVTTSGDIANIPQGPHGLWIWEPPLSLFEQGPLDIEF